MRNSFFFRHNDEGDSFHLDLHEPFVTAYSVEEDSGVFIAFSTLSMLFNPLKAYHIDGLGNERGGNSGEVYP